MEAEKKKIEQRKMAASMKERKGVKVGTQFSAFDAIQVKKMEAEKARVSKAKEKRTITKNKRKKRKKNKNQKPTLAAASAQIEFDKVKILLDSLHEKYPDNYDIQLKSITDFFEMKLGDATTGNKKIFDEKAYGRKLEIPFSYLDPKILPAVGTYLRTLPEKELVRFLNFLILEIVRLEKLKITSCLGLRVFIQIIIRSFPLLLLQLCEYPDFKSAFCASVGSLPKNSYKGKRLYNAKATFVKHEHVELMNWVFGQSLQSHKGVALTVWLKIFLPFECIRCVDVDEADKAIAMEFWTELITKNKHRQLRAAKLDKEVAAKSYEKLMILKALDEDAFEAGPLKRVSELLEKFTVWKKKGAPKSFFKMLLRSTGNELTRDDALEKLFEQLEEDEGCYVVWKGAYEELPRESANLMIYLTENWRYTSEQLHVGKLYALASLFVSLNTKLAQSESLSAKDLRRCDTACKQLLHQIQPSFISLLVKFIFYPFLVVALVALLIYGYEQNKHMLM
eukprot:TRINITY_DN8026_c0_g1_i1.p1 TRINITY_DN8026_c0_g1~~TRINITY_DN8026_c0_g1_i1.p1  ORF type:complete len:576 (-),score=120.63 TRINITY_DN8026_c0_g1_i1:57-1580(-)